ncbi:MAG: glycoside hydrolase family 2 TIM barrel-domain containing protein [Bacteroidota bacterium]|nr:glycoside hydrolase family 2 TIM barrel-domain containing protein [Bacteroidota bacterium]
MQKKKCTLIFLLFISLATLSAQKYYELNSNWKCINIKMVKVAGERLSDPAYDISGWMPAVVPGTVLATLLNQHLIPDPFYGMNNKKIPDIYDTGRDYYTYWFVNDFNEKVNNDKEQVWLHLRGVNYGCDVFLNGHKLNRETHYGMFLRQNYNITSFLSANGKNRLAVIVYPVNPAGNPNGGQGGDGTIARNVSHQYVAGWDWIQPVRDRNTGIWDKVTVEKTISIDLRNPHVVTLVPGKRLPGKQSVPAIIKASCEIENPNNEILSGTLRYLIEGAVIKKEVSLQPKSTVEISLPDYSLENPRLWWPNGYGDHPLYNMLFQFVGGDGEILDQEEIKTGIREIRTTWNDHTQSRQVSVNGQKIFIKGGNWIVSDALLRLSPERYDAEIRFHRDMNLNLIRIWGGALTERPEFYEACDKYGLLVFQDLWFSGDCNGKWVDPMKKEDQWTRRQYPDDHKLLLETLADQVKMIRNHPSLAFWCGGNEITPPEDLLMAMKDSLLPALDGTRYFFPYSNCDSMSYNSTGGNGDGPYTIQPVTSFWEQRTFPFNSEVGSVGTGDYESLERFIPAKNLTVPQYSTGKIDSVWVYHKDLGYGKYIDLYGKTEDIKDFGDKAQLVNYEQYRALGEGFSSHAWDWYTGFIIWKTQNPWTALRGQMYDYYLDPNACLYGLHHGCEPLHVMCNPADGMVSVVNNTFFAYHDLMLEVKLYDMKGMEFPLNRLMIEVSPVSVQKFFPVKQAVDQLGKDKGLFLFLSLSDARQKIYSENLYWLPDSTGNYSGLRKMSAALVNVEAEKVSRGKIEVKITNPLNGPVAFFNRISLVDGKKFKRILPVFYSDNYISVLPGKEKSITIEYTPSKLTDKAVVSLRGWNVREQNISVK